MVNHSNGALLRCNWLLDPLQIVVVDVLVMFGKISVTSLSCRYDISTNVFCDIRYCRQRDSHAEWTVKNMFSAMEENSRSTER
jgi:hypothetical protein